MLIVVFANTHNDDVKPDWYIDGLVHDCSNSIANALWLLQSAVLH